MTRIDVLATAGDTSWVRGHMLYLLPDKQIILYYLCPPQVSLPPAPPKFSCIPFLCTGARLKAPLYEQYYQVVRLSKIQYSSMDEHHHDIMSTLFTKVTGRSKYQTDWKMFGFQVRLQERQNVFDCRRFGLLFDVQNVDFSTDLRGVGMLGPLQMLWLSENYPVIAKEWLTADDPESGKVYYPFALQSLSMTSYSLRVCGWSPRLHLLFEILILTFLETGFASRTIE